MNEARERSLYYFEQQHQKERTEFIKDYESLVNNFLDGKKICDSKYMQLFNISQDLDSSYVPYSEITRIVYGLKDTTGLSDLCSTIESKFYSYLEQHKNVQGTFMIKVIEHTKLANKQLVNLYNSSEREIQSLATSTKKLKAQQKDIDNTYKTMREENKNLSSNLITILGIFTAITFAIFGGLQLLGNIFGNVISSKGLSHFVIGNSIILCGFFIFAVYIIMMILFMSIGKLINANLNLSVKESLFIIIIDSIIIIFGYWYSGI